MIGDAALPPGFRPATTVAAERAGVAWTSARLSADELGRLAASLEGSGGTAARAIGPERLAGPWEATVDAFLDPASEERRRLAEPLARLTRLSPAGLDAGLAAVLGGQRGAAVAELLERAAEERAAGRGEGGLVAVILAGNLPALAVQPLLPALALGRPVLLKSPSSEPLFAPAFVRALVRRLPELAPALAAVTWPGGRAELEAPVLAAAKAVVAYGEDETVADLERRAGGEVVGYGARISLGVVGGDAEVEDAAEGLARDVALFDQRGCLSVHAVYAAGDAGALAEALAGALGRRAEAWPPGPAEPAALAGASQVRLEAQMRGLACPHLALESGTVVVEPAAELRPSPGARTVRVHPVESLAAVPGLLEPWRGRLQGVALAGGEAWALAPELEALGVTRTAAPGELQTPDALWHNGGVHPLAALAR